MADYNTSYTYLNLSDVKSHLNIDSSFTDDDNYIQLLMAAAEEIVSRQIDQPLSMLEDNNHNIPTPLICAMYLWIGSAYAIRESVSSVNMTVVPNGFEMLCNLYTNYSYDKSNYKNNRES